MLDAPLKDAVISFFTCFNWVSLKFLNFKNRNASRLLCVCLQGMEIHSSTFLAESSVPLNGTMSCVIHLTTCMFSHMEKDAVVDCNPP